MRMRRGCKGMWIALLAALADRLGKLAAQRLPGGVVRLIPGIVNLRRVENRGIAFSMLSGQGWALVGLTALVMAALVTWLLARPDAPALCRAGLWLVVGGGLGNLYDRVTRGAVCDFIELAFVRFAVFNVADVCICVGAALVVLGAWGKERAAGSGRQGNE